MSATHEEQDRVLTPRPSALHGELVERFAQVFFVRWDWYALQKEDGSYRAVNQPLKIDLVIRHLRRELTLGTFILDAKSHAKLVCFDADDDQGWQTLLSLGERLRADGHMAYAERSRRGGHLWIFFAEPLPGIVAVRFAQALLGSGAGKIEVFPKQTKLSGGPGSLVRLPLGIHRKDGKRYPLVRAGAPFGPTTLSQQLTLIAESETVPTAYVARVLAEAVSTTQPQPRAILTAQHGLIDAIKQRIDIYRFVGQYVDLDASGVGRCPFHDDTHKSFSVHRERQFWNCFAGCGGGDVIVFWEKHQGINRSQAVRELAAVAGVTPRKEHNPHEPFRHW